MRSSMGCRGGCLDEFVPLGELTFWQDKPADDGKLRGLFFNLSPSMPQAMMTSLLLEVEVILILF